MKKTRRLPWPTAQAYCAIPSHSRAALRVGLAALLAGALGAAVRPLEAELVVFSGGDVLKVVEYELLDERMRLTLPSGGTLVVSLGRVERVVDDEIVPPWSLREPAAESLFSLQFDAAKLPPETPFGDLIHAVARRHGLSSELMVAMVRAESNFDPRAVSVKGARGLLQLMPATAERFDVDPTRLHDPAANLEAGGRYLSWLVERFGGDLVKVLAAYNAGEGVVARYGGVPPYRETQAYVRRIYADLGLDGEW